MVDRTHKFNAAVLPFSLKLFAAPEEQGNNAFPTIISVLASCYILLGLDFF